MSLKPVRYSDQTTAISPFDSAIDHDNSNWDEYGKVMFKNPAAWREHIKAKDGHTFTEFIIGVIPTEQLVRIHDECDKLTSEQLRWRCFLHGLREIKGWEGDVPEGGIPTKEYHGVKYVDPEWLTKTFIRSLRMTALHVGMLAWSFNQITEEETKN